MKNLFRRLGQTFQTSMRNPLADITNPGSKLAIDAARPVSPSRLLIVIVLSIFGGELLIMIVFSLLPPISTVVENLLDASILVALVSPVFYQFVFRPLVGFISQYQQTNEELKQLQRELEGRAAALATVAEVGTATSTILETKRLLQEVVDLTKDRFDLYHSHIYLLDEARENLVLASGAGEPGRQMVAKGHSIPFSREQSLVARAARERKGVTVNDVTQAPDFLPNPLLPDTRSELAVPMIVAGNVIGVFDVQSDQVGRFAEADINIQTTLAAQVAASIQNVRSFERAKAQAEFEAHVSAIGQKIQRATSVEDALQTAIREIGLALGAQRVSASLGTTRQDGGDGASRN